MTRLVLALSIVLPISAVVAAPGGGLLFSDVTADSGIDFSMTSGETPSRDILEVDGGGVALFDYDADGDLDLFFANGATMKDTEHGPGSRLYANAGDGTFRDVTEQVGIRLRRWAMGVAAADYDGDGDDDLYVTCFGANVLLRNDVASDGGFVDVTSEAGVGHPGWGTSAAFADLDGDADPDLYVVNYLDFDPRAPPDRRGRMFLGVPVMAGPAGLPARADVLYENLGNGRFKDVTAQSGCGAPQPGYGLGVAIFDADRDGRPEIFVGNDSTENFLFRNLGKGKFKESGVVAGISSNYDGGNQATMGIAIADVDGNGFPDLFTTNFSSDTNTLHLNLDGKFFDDRTSQFGLAMLSRPFLGWGTGFVDLDSDGDEDLFVANGHVYPEASPEKMDSSYEQPPLLFERIDGRFRRVTEAGAIFATPHRGRATAFGDLDDDGDVDIVMTTLNGAVRLLRNDAPHRDVIVVELRERNGGRLPTGAVVELSDGRTVQRRWLHGGSFQSVDAPRAYFGVGGGGAREWTLRVIWSGGKSVEHGPIPLNRRITIREGSPAFESVPLRGRTQPSASHSSRS